MPVSFLLLSPRFCGTNFVPDKEKKLSVLVLDQKFPSKIVIVTEDSINVHHEDIQCGYVDTLEHLTIGVKSFFSIPKDNFRSIGNIVNSWMSLDTKLYMSENKNVDIYEFDVRMMLDVKDSHEKVFQSVPCKLLCFHDKIIFTLTGGTSEIYRLKIDATVQISVVPSILYSDDRKIFSLVQKNTDKDEVVWVSCKNERAAILLALIDMRIRFQKWKTKNLQDKDRTVEFASITKTFASFSAQKIRRKIFWNRRKSWHAQITERKKHSNDLVDQGLCSNFEPNQKRNRLQVSVRRLLELHVVCKKNSFESPDIDMGAFVRKSIFFALKNDDIEVLSVNNVSVKITSTYFTAKFKINVMPEHLRHLMTYVDSPRWQQTENSIKERIHTILFPQGKLHALMLRRVFYLWVHFAYFRVTTQFLFSTATKQVLKQAFI
eukprot:g168.t1